MTSTPDRKPVGKSFPFVAGTGFNNFSLFKENDSTSTPGALYLDQNHPVKSDILLINCVWNIAAVSSTSVRVEVWRKLANDVLINVFTDPNWIPASKLGICGSRFYFYAKAGDLIGLRCSESNPVSYSRFYPKPGNTLARDVAPAAADTTSGIPINAFKVLDRTYAYSVMGLRYQEGRLLVLHDEWTLSEIGFQQAADTQAFASNIIKLFSGNWPNSRFLIYSTNSHLLGSSLENTITSSKNFVVKGRSNPLDLNTLRTYDAIFVGGEPVDNQMLIDYIKTGGSVCVIAGTGFGGSQAEAAQWNQLLGAFGLRLDSSYNNINGVLPVTNTDHPLFAGVKSLYQNLGQTIHVLPESKASMIMTSGTQGLIAYASVPVASA